jgi:RNA polymerase sigma-70 factor (ECF subfamily)
MSDVTKEPGTPSDRARPSAGPGSTSESLLERLKARDEPSWRDFVKVYTPLVMAWCSRGGVRGHDAEDVAQEVFRTVAAKMAGFTRARHGSFRAWLREVTRHKVLHHRDRAGRQPKAFGGSEGEALLAGVGVQPPDGPDELDGASERAIFHRGALELILSKVAPRTCEAARLTIVEGRRPADVALELGMSTNAVLIARSRVLARARKLLQELPD